MAYRIEGQQLQRVILLLGLILICLVLASFVPQMRALYLFGAVGGLIMFGVAFLTPQTGLIFLIISMLLSPEFGAGGLGGAGQEAARGVVIRLDDVFLVLFGLGWFARGAVHKELGLFRRSPLNRPIAAYLVVGLISTLLGAAFGSVRLKIGFFFILRYFEYFVVFYMVLNYVSDLKQIKRYTYLAIAVCVVVSFVAILQIPSGERVSAPFEGEAGEPNTLGGYLVFFMAIGLGFALTARRPKTILKYLAFVAYISIPLLFTLSRASWLAAVPMWIALIVLTRRKKTLLAVTVVFLVVGPAILPTAVQERALFIFKQQAQRGQLKVAGLKFDTSTSARLSTWATGIEGWKRAPILGHGITGFVFMDAQYVRVLAETGLLGMATFVWLLVTLYKVGLRAYRVCRDDEWLSGLMTGYLAGFVALLVHAIGSNTFIILRIMEPFMLYTGLVLIATEIRERELAASPAGEAEAEKAKAVPASFGVRRGPAGLRPRVAPLRPKTLPRSPRTIRR